MQGRPLRVVAIDEVSAAQLAPQAQLVAVVVDDDTGTIAEVLQGFPGVGAAKPKIRFQSGSVVGAVARGEMTSPVTVSG